MQQRLFRHQSILIRTEMMQAMIDKFRQPLLCAFMRYGVLKIAFNITWRLRKIGLNVVYRLLPISQFLVIPKLYNLTTYLNYTT